MYTCIHTDTLYIRGFASAFLVFSYKNYIYPLYIRIICIRRMPDHPVERFTPRMSNVTAGMPRCAKRVAMPNIRELESK